MTPVFKVTSTLVAASITTAGSIYFGTDLFREKNVVTKKTIVSLIAKKHPQKRLITSNSISDVYGKKAYRIYREENKGHDKGQDSGKLDGGTRPSEVSNEVDTTTEFISRCNSNQLVEVEGEDDFLYQQVLRYCTRDTLVKDLIEERSGKRLISSVNGQDTEAGNAAGGLYKTSNNISGKAKDTWEFSDGDSKKGGNDLPQDFKTKCDEKAKMPAFELENENYKNVLSGCTTNK